MNFTDDELEKMGSAVKGRAKALPPDDTEKRLFVQMCILLKAIADKPDPVVNVAAPEVTVQAPEVKVAAPYIPAPVVNVPAPVVNVPPAPEHPKPFSEWEFTITDSKGNVKTIIAKAIK